MKKLNEIARNCNITAYGFQALKDFAQESKKDGSSIVISSLSPAVMAEMGIMDYYAPVLPRGTILNTADDVRNADLSVQHVLTLWAPDLDYGHYAIVSRHAGTIEILKEQYPDAEVLDGNVTPEELHNKFVVGTLPPALIQHAKAYRAVTIADFDYAKDGDLGGEELADRIRFSEPITVEIR
ncbi:hypothetical protein [[Clostridium] scindens]|uniref:hypothetical protein n=1 Tax=Clostridium scindens (strain JCM 10418 / VPI 12708) TaxID=29347 RepID=UPI001E449FB5|nr:hypothetical protein [[Clostridium] scindens]BCZ31284.1 hypothetical protein CSCING10_024780 [[Clostridium] scindens]